MRGSILILPTRGSAVALLCVASFCTPVQTMMEISTGAVHHVEIPKKLNFPVPPVFALEMTLTRRASLI